MNEHYLQLARKRADTDWAPYLQPEDFGYDFREWVSPYTKSAHTVGGTLLILQDWASADGLAGGINPVIQHHGRIPTLLTNKRLDEVLRRVLKCGIADVYVTNAFPFIKPGGMSANIPLRDMLRAIREFTVRELELAQPSRVIALGSLTHRALSRAGIDALHVPHPAARGMTIDSYTETWRSALGA